MLAADQLAARAQTGKRQRQGAPRLVQSAGKGPDKRVKNTPIARISGSAA
jgi:hypothetical protein